jgi:DNA polymerase II
MEGIIERTGWLLDLYEDPLGGLALWFLGDDGKRRRLRQRFPVTFYVSGDAGRLRTLESWLQRQAVALRCEGCLRQDVFAGKRIPVLAVEVQRMNELSGLFREASWAFPDLTFADADLPVSLRYAATTGVYPLGRCKVTLDRADFVQSILPLDDPWQLDPREPPLRVLSLEPDCNPSHATPRWLQLSYGEQSCQLSLHPPRALLANLRAVLESYDPDLLLTSWGDTWLLPYLLTLSQECHFPLPLNRDPDAVIARRDERWYFSYGQIVYRGEQVHLFGRWHVDRKNAMLWSDYQLDGVLEMARVTGLPLQTSARVSPGTGISAIQMQAALRQGILVPWQKQQVERPRPAYDLFAADQGGMVYRPIPGVHRDIAGIDFISMYPAIMVYCNISPETIDHRGEGAETVPGLSLIIDRDPQRVGLVPLALKPLLEKRVNLKYCQASLPAWDERREKYKRRSSALKWLLVTCFGYLGYKNARFGRIEAHQAVTAYGREALLQAKETAENMGFEVLQMYVDGLWVKAAGKTSPADYDDLLVEVRTASGLPIALDGIYRWVVFLSSRVDPTRPVANRYFGIFQNGEIKMRGVAARRRDTPAFIARVQSELVEILGRGAEPEDALPEAIAWLRRALRSLARTAQKGRAPDQIPLADLLVSQRISREIEDYRSLSPAARAAAQLKEAGKLVKPGQRVRFLYMIGHPGVHAWDLPMQPNTAALDTARYRTLLLRAAAEVLEPFGAPEEVLRVQTG